MQKINASYCLIFLCLILGVTAYGQSSFDKSKKIQTAKIEKLSIYPNPVTNGKVFISTKLNLSKQVEIYDVLGKKVMARVLKGKELQINDLNSGIYIIKIKEANASATRKLVIR